jgi:hypothetical protein
MMLAPVQAAAVAARVPLDKTPKRGVPLTVAKAVTGPPTSGSGTRQVTRPLFTLVAAALQGVLGQREVRVEVVLVRLGCRLAVS